MRRYTRTSDHKKNILCLLSSNGIYREMLWIEWISLFIFLPSDTQIFVFAFNDTFTLENYDDFINGIRKKIFSLEDLLLPLPTIITCAGLFLKPKTVFFFFYYSKREKKIYKIIVTRRDFLQRKKNISNSSFLCSSLPSSSRAHDRKWSLRPNGSAT